MDFRSTVPVDRRPSAGIKGLRRWRSKVVGHQVRSAFSVLGNDTSLDDVTVASRTGMATSPISPALTVPAPAINGTFALQRGSFLRKYQRRIQEDLRVSPHRKRQRRHNRPADRPARRGQVGHLAEESSASFLSNTRGGSRLVPRLYYQ